MRPVQPVKITHGSDAKTAFRVRIVLSDVMTSLSGGSRVTGTHSTKPKFDLVMFCHNRHKRVSSLAGFCFTV